jgi:hypothetical protein
MIRFVCNLKGQTAARAARRLVEQPRRQRAGGLPQPQPPQQRLEQQRVPACPELAWQTLLKGRRDQMIAPALFGVTSNIANCKKAGALVGRLERRSTSARNGPGPFVITEVFHVAR